MLMKNSVYSSVGEDSLGPHDNVFYLKLELTPAWAKKQTHQTQEPFIRCVYGQLLIHTNVFFKNLFNCLKHSRVSCRDVLLQVLLRPQLVVCYKAKDFLRTALQCYKQEINWKQGRTHAHTHTRITSMQLWTHLYWISCVVSGWVSYSGPTGVRLAAGSCKSLLMLPGPPAEILQTALCNNSHWR